MAAVAAGVRMLPRDSLTKEIDSPHERVTACRSPPVEIGDSPPLA